MIFRPHPISWPFNFAVSLARICAFLWHDLCVHDLSTIFWTFLSFPIQEPVAASVAKSFLRRGLRLDLRPCQEHFAHVRDLWRRHETRGCVPLEAFRSCICLFILYSKKKIVHCCALCLSAFAKREQNKKKMKTGKTFSIRWRRFLCVAPAVGATWESNPTSHENYQFYNSFHSTLCSPETVDQQKFGVR